MLIYTFPQSGQEIRTGKDPFSHFRKICFLLPQKERKDEA